LQAISDERATISGAPNVAYDVCVERISPAERATLDLTCWAAAFNGSEPVCMATLERFASTFAACGFRRTAFAPCYGLAEATLMVSAAPVGSGPVVRRQDAADVVSCGPVIDDTRLLVVDPETRSVCRAGQVGELWLAGPSVANGYWRQLAATHEMFHAQLQPESATELSGPDASYLRTGDLGFVSDGELFITGRRKAQLVLAGRNLQAEDVERTVASSHAAGWPGGIVATSRRSGAEDGRDHLIIFQEIDPRQAPTEASRLAIIGAIRRCVAEQHQVPVMAVVLARPGSLPRTSSGKVRRLACDRAYAAGELDVLVAWQLGQPA
jgi:acyl-CoA synthetase (AMP-forming)/AMP-acid ligase II